MADEFSIPHTWREVAWFAIVALLANRANWFAAYFKRKQTKADVDKTEEEKRELEIANDIKSGDALVKLTVRMLRVTERAERLEARNKVLEAENKLLNQQVDKYISVENRVKEGNL
jgi:uncharacterized protein YpmS